MENNCEAMIEPCDCGENRRAFWLWEDSAGQVHASRFAPTMGTIRRVVAATSRDAMLSFQGTLQPKHTVRDADDPGTTWVGRCSTASAG